jgi:hypothetical protein
MVPFAFLASGVAAISARERTKIRQSALMPRL